VNTYPFNSARVQLDPHLCPAPFCGRAIRHAWITAVTFSDENRFESFEAASTNPFDYVAQHLATCRREACITWAQLRAEDLRGGPSVDPAYVAYLWRHQPRPIPPEEMQRERLERHLRESVDRIRDTLRRRPIA
jgi:hypothetical protein